MSDNTSREAFEVWLAGHDPRSFCPNAYWEHDYKWKAWQASRKQALEEVAALFPDISAGYRSTTIKQAIEELK